MDCGLILFTSLVLNPKSQIRNRKSEIRNQDMELRTTFNIEPSPVKITYNDRVMLIGSCFASSIGFRMEMGRLPVMINPAGAVYNPVSVYNTLETIISGKEAIIDDLYNFDRTYVSFNHYTDFSDRKSVV